MLVRPRVGFVFVTTLALVLSGSGCNKSSSTQADDENPNRKQSSGSEPTRSPSSPEPKKEPKPNAAKPEAKNDTPGANDAAQTAILSDPRAKVCQSQWQRSLAGAKVGTVMTWEVTSTPGDGAASKRTERREWTEVKADAFTVEIITTKTAPTQQSPIKTLDPHAEDLDLRNCVASSDDPEAVKTEVLDRHQEKVSVRAGEFEAIYSKTHATTVDWDGEVVDLVVETWDLPQRAGSLDGVLKSIVETSQMRNGVRVVDRDERELIEFKTPL